MIIFKTSLSIVLCQQLYFCAGFAGVELIFFIAAEVAAFWICAENSVDNIELLTVQQVQFH